MSTPTDLPPHLPLAGLQDLQNYPPTTNSVVPPRTRLKSISFAGLEPPFSPLALSPSSVYPSYISPEKPVNKTTEVSAPILHPKDPEKSSKTTIVLP